VGGSVKRSLAMAQIDREETIAKAFGLDAATRPNRLCGPKLKKTGRSQLV